MTNQISIVKNSILRQHEQVRFAHVQKLVKILLRDKYVKNPLIVDVSTNIILDGHHRFNALLDLGLSSSPVYLC